MEIRHASILVFPLAAGGHWACCRVRDPASGKMNRKIPNANSIREAISNFVTVLPPNNALRGLSTSGDRNCAKWFADMRIANDNVLLSALNLFPMSDTHEVIKIFKPIPDVSEPIQ